MLGSCDTLKMTVLDNDETFAMDEFYFSFFSRTPEVFAKLQTCLDSKSDRKFLEPENLRVSGESTKFRDSVRDTTTLIRASSPTGDTFESSGSSARRQSSESTHSREFMEDAEFLESDQKQKPSFRSPRSALRHFSLGSITGRRSSRSSSPQTSHSRPFSDSFEKIPSRTISPEPEHSWSQTRKMLWSRGVVNVADWVRQRSAEVGSHVGIILSGPTSTINAGVDKVSKFWNGDGLRNDHARWVTEETAKDMRDQNPEERFQTHFALPPTEKLLGSYYGYFFRTFPFYGKMYVSKQHLCFRSLLPGIKTKVCLNIIVLMIDGPAH